MAPKEEQEPSTRFLPYLPPNASRRERELQNSQVRSVAASRAATRFTNTETKVERKIAASTTQQSEGIWSSRRDSASTYSVQQFLDGLETDPLMFLPHASPNDRLFIDNYIHVLLSEAAPVYELFDVCNIRDAFFLRLFQDQDFYYIGMALCLVKVGNFVSSDRSAHMRRGYELIGHGLSRLRERIAKSHQVADDITIMATAYLAELASLTNDHQAHSIHRSSLQSMLRSKGGLDSLGYEGAVKRSLLQMRSDWILRSSSSREEVAFLNDVGNNASMHPTSSTPLMQPFELHQLPSTLPEGFQAIAVQRQLSPRTISIVHGASQMEKTTFPIPSYQIEQRISLELQPRTFINFAEALPAVGQELEESEYYNEVATLNNMTMIALFLFVCGELNTHQPPVSSLLQDQFKAFRKSLTTELLRLDIPIFVLRCGCANYSEREQIEACLTWIYAVTIHSWTTKSREFSIEGLELTARLKWLTAVLNSYANVNPLLQRFLWSESLLSSLELCWNTINP